MVGLKHPTPNFPSGLSSTLATAFSAWYSDSLRSVNLCLETYNLLNTSQPSYSPGLTCISFSLSQSKFSLLQTPAQTSPPLWHSRPHHFSLLSVFTVWISHVVISHTWRGSQLWLYITITYGTLKNADPQAQPQKDSDSIGLFWVLDFKVFKSISVAWPGPRALI